MPFLSNATAMTTYTDRTWILDQELRYKGEQDEFVVPAGFITDFATVPRVVAWLVPTYGRYTRAAILHDWLCTTGICTGVVSSRDADGLFRRVMREEGVPITRRWLMWAGVRWGALFNGTRRPGFIADLPLVLLLTVLSAPFVVPVSVLVAAGIAVYGLVELVIEKIFDRGFEG